MGCGLCKYIIFTLFNEGDYGEPAEDADRNEHRNVQVGECCGLGTGVSYSAGIRELIGIRNMLALATGIKRYIYINTCGKRL